MGYAIVTITKDSELRGTQLVPTKEYGVLSLPSGTYFEFRRAKGTAGYTNPASAATQLSDRIEAVLNLPDVTSVVWSQHPSASGQLLDWMTTYYSAADGAISGSVESDLAHFGPTYTGQQISDEIIADFPSINPSAYDDLGSPGPGV